MIAHCSLINLKLLSTADQLSEGYKTTTGAQTKSTQVEKMDDMLEKVKEHSDLLLEVISTVRSIHSEVS